MRLTFVAPVVGALVLLLGGCAKISAPSGGEVDREPPQVVTMEPEQFAVVPEWDRPVVFRFDERISEKGIRESVIVSPETGAVKVKKGRSELRVSLEGGWRPGQIYRVVVLPVVQDLFNNTRSEEVELIFSTGPEIPATAAAGLLTDRLTGQPLGGARVEAVNEADSVTYVALSDTAGFFALRHIPAGDYSLIAYLDRNRNGRLDYGEPQARDGIALGAADTVVVSYALLAADTTPARVIRAEERDSLQIRISLDDHVDPEVPLDEVEVEIRELPDSTLITGAKVMHVHAFEEWQAELQAAIDSARAVEEAERAAAEEAARAADSTGVAADSSGVAVDSPGVALDTTRLVSGARTEDPTPTTPPRMVEDESEEHGPAEPLPIRELVVVPAEPLARKTRYEITISGIRNINGVGGGGGSVVFETAAAVEPDTVDLAPADSTGVVPPDTLAKEPPVNSGAAVPGPGAISSLLSSIRRR